MPTAGLSLPKNQESLDCLGPWPQPYRAPLDALDNSFRCEGPLHGQHSLCAFILSIWGGGICWPRLSLSTLPHPWVHPHTCAHTMPTRFSSSQSEASPWGQHLPGHWPVLLKRSHLRLLASIFPYPPGQHYHSLSLDPSPETPGSPCNSLMKTSVFRSLAELVGTLLPLLQSFLPFLLCCLILSFTKHPSG